MWIFRHVRLRFCFADLGIGLGHYPWREGWIACRPREPRQLFGREQRWHQPVHWLVGFFGKFKALPWRLFASRIAKLLN
jgi:hypothetical protein